MPAFASAEAVTVELQQTDDGWVLLRGGEPYFIRGAGGDGPLDRLQAAGANSIRTWGADGAAEILDAAHELGMTVTLGIWLGHERHGFDYDDPEQVAQQLETVREVVLQHRDHPALLLWGLGNEMEGFESGDDAAIWKAVNDAATLVKSLDPNHPTMVVTAEIGGGRIKRLHDQSPAIDIHGINSYGGAVTLLDRLRQGGARKPFVLTEFGPMGAWEMRTTAWGAPFEQTSTEKAAAYRRSYEQAVLAAPGQSLGSYAFLWSEKMEVTPTWFGMLLPDGAKLSAVDTMTALWGGATPADLSPRIGPLIVDGATSLDPGDTLRLTAQASDPEGRDIRYRWTLRVESGDLVTGGDFRPTPPDLDNYLLTAAANEAVFRMPDEPGAYRIYAYAFDPAGNAATANVPLLVKGEPRPILPVVVYEESFDAMPWAPSGWMGNTVALTLDGSASEQVFDGEHSIRVRYDGTFGWAGIAWQHPADNWGESDRGLNLRGAGALELWARGEYGGEKVTFGVGLLDASVDFPDSGIVKSATIELGSEWQRYHLDLRQEDLSRLGVGFVLTLEGQAHAGHRLSRQYPLCRPGRLGSTLVRANRRVAARSTHAPATLPERFRDRSASSSPVRRQSMPMPRIPPWL